MSFAKFSALIVATTITAGCQALLGIQDLHVGESDMDADAGAIDADVGPIDADIAPIDAEVNPTVVSIAALRNLPDGPADAVIESATVTYIGTDTNNQTRFYLQQQIGEPGIAVLIGASPPPVEVGNQIDMRVTSMATYSGNREVTGFTLLRNDQGSRDVVQQLARDVSFGPGMELNADFESQLVLIRQAQIVNVSADGLTYQISYGEASIQAAMFSEGAMNLGMDVHSRFDLVAVPVQRFGNIHIWAASVNDFTMVSIATCDWIEIGACDTGGRIAEFCPTGTSALSLRRCDGTTFDPDPGYLNYHLCRCDFQSCGCTGVAWDEVQCCSYVSESVH